MKKQTKAGFTLIELLVVILIIGILAAVAVPQYKKAVVKSRLAAIKPILQTVKKYHELNYLENGFYDRLSVQGMADISNVCKKSETGSIIFNCGHGFLINLYLSSETAIRAYYCPGNEKNYENCWTKANDFQYTIYLHHSSHPDKIACHGVTDLGKAVCKSEIL